MDNFSREVTGDIVVHSVNINRATMKEAGEFKQALLKDINGGQKKLIIDLSKCEFMDSSFLGSLIMSCKEAEKHGSILKIAGVHSDAQVILEITGTSKIFDQYKNKNEAIKSFNGNT
ncbi:MAG: STAS domain-containing protein [Ignavibacteriaceae bacterium]